MTVYFVTGATGFLGSRLMPLLLGRDDCSSIQVLVRKSSFERLAELSSAWPNGDRVVPVVGDLGEPLLGIDPATLVDVPDHVVHLAALYDITASDEANIAANVVGTKHALGFAEACNEPLFHHVSSIAVSGNYRNRFTETDFEVDQTFPSPYHRTKFESEKLVRERCAGPYRIYRPSVVVGDSRTGEMDKIDGPYYALPLVTRLARLPSRLPLIGPNLGSVNLVPVDFVVSSMNTLMHADAPSGSVFHLSSPQSDSLGDIYNAFAAAANAPQMRTTFPVPHRRSSAKADVPISAGKRRTFASKAIAGSLTEVGVPPEAIRLLDLPVKFDSARTQRFLSELGVRSTPPPFSKYADVLYEYWADNLDPDRARRVDHRRPLAGRRIVITGASSGIGRALSLTVAKQGAVVIMIARRGEELDAVRQEIVAIGGQASTHVCDITDPAAVDTMVKQIIECHGGADILVNNAGRSIRRSMMLSIDRMHDFERTMDINYLAAVRLTLAFMPSMLQQQHGHIVNITSQAVEGHAPRFAAYTASKAALEEFSLVAGRDLLAEGVSFSSVRMPLVKTPMSAPSAKANRFIPLISAEKAAELIVKQALLRKREVVSTPFGRLSAFSNAVAPRLTLTVTHLLSIQGTGETAPDGRQLNSHRHPGIAMTSTATRLVWRALGSRRTN